MRNKPNLYEMTLAKPLHLPSEWDVELIDIASLHIWTNFEKYYQYLTFKSTSDANARDNAKLYLSAEKDNKDQNYGIIKFKKLEN